MYNPMRSTTLAAAAAMAVLNLTSSVVPVTAFISSATFKEKFAIEMELHQTIEHIRSELQIEQRPKYFLRGAEQLCTEVELGTDFFSDAAMDEARRLDDVVRSHHTELDFSTGVHLTTEIDERCVKLGGSSFLVTFGPDADCDPENYEEGQRLPAHCKNVVTIKNFPVCLANCICADVAAAKMNNNITIVKTNGELNKQQQQQQQQQQQRPPVGVPSATDIDADDVSIVEPEVDMEINPDTYTLDDAPPILRMADYTSTKSDSLITGILFLAAGILVVATVTLV